MQNSSINSQNNCNKECTKIQIVSIKNPFDFWISVRQQENLNVISSTIANDKYIRLDYECTKIELSRNKFPLIGYHSSDNKWYRARLIEFKRVFGGEEELVCFLIDKGETCSAPIDDFKKITNPKLINFSPLVKQCALYGIKPIADGNIFRLVLLILLFFSQFVELICK
jgi:hypothetical protein